MSLDDLTPEAVMLAMDEFRRLDREPFLARYGFGKAVTHYIVLDGMQYDAKAIAGVAHQYISSGSPVLKRFKSGEQTVNRKLTSLGFDVQPLGKSSTGEPESDIRNPTWTREELILVLEAYLEHAGNPPGKESQQVRDLSSLLNQLGERLGRGGSGTYRNANGVYMKMMNLRRLDPAYVDTGRTGLSRGGRLEDVVWREFAGDLEILRRVASAIRAELDQPIISMDDDEGAEEGRIITALHRRRERDTGLVKKRKHQALRNHGELRCEGCDLSFGARYGERGEGYIEVHHTKPLHQMEPGDKTQLADLALVCANCHRMIHRRMPWLGMDELRATVVRS